MFSGIIKNTAKPKSVRKDKESMRLVFPVPKGWELEEGESINIDGICSTVEKTSGRTFQVYYMPETLKRTALKTLSNNHISNLERCLNLNDLIGGHLVYGHVDAAGKVLQVKKVQDSVLVQFNVPSTLTKYMVCKGSVAVNGVSLTIVSANKNSFSVSLIPYTLEHTNLGALKVGDLVNIEVDMFAKHIEKLLARSD